MFDSAAQNPTRPAPGLDPGVALQLPVDAYFHLVHTLRLTLPPPLSDSAEDLARRDHAAIARIAALVPANAAEADMAAMFVAASEQWKDCLRLAQLPETKPEWASKCRAQALAMMRQANGALRLLLRMQNARRKLEADDAARDRAAWTEHCALGLMAEALGHPATSGDFAGTPPAAPPAMAEPSAPEPEPSEADPGSARPANLSAGTPCPGEAAAKAAPAPDLVAAAERYAAVYPERAAAIRRTGKLPPDVMYFCPPEAALARALITRDTPALAALDLLPIGAPDMGTPPTTRLDAPIQGNCDPDRASAEHRAA